MSDAILHKLTPIYKHIENGNWRGAIKLCQRRDLEKYDITRALMAYCLVQTNKEEQALEIAMTVKVRMTLMLLLNDFFLLLSLMMLLLLVVVEDDVVDLLIVLLLMTSCCC